MPIVWPSCSVSDTRSTAFSSKPPPEKKPPPNVERDLDVAGVEQRRRVVRHGRLGALRLGREQHLRVVVLRLREDARDRPLLDHLAGAHDVDAVGEAADDAEVVGDEDHRHAEPRLQALQKLQDLRLDGHVERGRRLVGDQDVGIVGERHGDHHALPLAAGKLVRIGVDAPLRAAGSAPAAGARSPARAPPCRLRPPMLDQRLGDLVADPVERIERGHRLLEDHGDLGAADAVQLALAEPEQLRAAIAHRAGRRGRSRRAGPSPPSPSGSCRSRIRRRPRPSRRARRRGRCP